MDENKDSEAFAEGTPGRLRDDQDSARCLSHGTTDPHDLPTGP